MPSGAAQPPSQEPPRDASADASGEQPGGAPPSGTERVGPLAILRTRKADGRALLLYSRVEHDASDEPA
jgi:hypothetical protein